MSSTTDEQTGRTRSRPERVTFGFRDVAESERQGMVNAVFSNVAERYDLMNDLMSGGVHRLWKDDLINWLAPPKGPAAFRLLDVAGGTGDVGMRCVGAAGGDAMGGAPQPGLPAAEGPAQATNETTL